jgi:hypothetical protein
MRILGTKSEAEGLLDAVPDALTAVRSGPHRGLLLKAAVVAGGLAALTAGSAAISSLRRRIGANS